MLRGSIDLKKLKRGRYTHVVYTSDGVRITVAGKTVGWKADRIDIQSVLKPWKYWRIARDDIETLVTYKDRKNVDRWLRTRPALLRLYERVLVIAADGDVNLTKLKPGSFAFVDYETAGGRKWVTGKVVDNENDEVSIQFYPWKKRRIVHGQIKKLVVGKNDKTVDMWFKEEYPKVRLKATSISRKWIRGSFVGSTTEALELLSDDGVQRIPLSSIDEFEVNMGRKNHMAFGVKMGIVLNLALPVLAVTLLG